MSSKSAQKKKKIKTKWNLYYNLNCTSPSSEAYQKNKAVENFLSRENYINIFETRDWKINY